MFDCNKNMSGVDRCDQMTAYYSTPRKAIRRYLKVFFRLFDIAIWNGNWLLNRINFSKMSYLEFRNNLALKLLNIDTNVLSLNLSGM